MSRVGHWESVYREKEPEQVSWHRPHLDLSLRWLEEAGLPKDVAILDVGAGASTWMDDLLQAGYRDLHALDISAAALRHTQGRLGPRAEEITWMVGDILTYAFTRERYDLWHDRAVFHFLTTDADKARYVEQLRAALRPGAQVFLSTFGPEGPERCSGLPVVRYHPEALLAQLGDGFRMRAQEMETHETPWGAPQQFASLWATFSP